MPNFCTVSLLLTIAGMAIAQKTATPAMFDTHAAERFANLALDQRRVGINDEEVKRIGLLAGLCSPRTSDDLHCRPCSRSH